MQPRPFKDFSESLKGYFNNKDLSDAVIQCEGKDFAVHKLVLFNHSQYFAEQLEEPLKESSDKAINIEDFEIDIVEAMVHFMYHFDYKTPEDSSSLILNTKVYQIADKYGIKSLKEHAARKFGHAANIYLNSDEFPIAVTLACTITPPTDMGLRNAILVTIFDRFDEIMGRSEFREVLKANPDFAIDLARFLFEKTRGIDRFKCPNCQQYFHFGCMDQDMKYCPLCHYYLGFWCSVVDS